MVLDDAVKFFYVNINIAAVFGFMLGILITWLPKQFHLGKWKGGVTQ